MRFVRARLVQRGCSQVRRTLGAGLRVNSVPQRSVMIAGPGASCRCWHAWPRIRRGKLSAVFKAKELDAAFDFAENDDVMFALLALAEGSLCDPRIRRGDSRSGGRGWLEPQRDGWPEGLGLRSYRLLLRRMAGAQSGQCACGRRARRSYRVTCADQVGAAVGAAAYAHAVQSRPHLEEVAPQGYRSLAGNDRAERRAPARGWGPRMVSTRS